MYNWGRDESVVQALHHRNACGLGPLHDSYSGNLASGYARSAKDTVQVMVIHEFLLVFARMLSGALRVGPPYTLKSSREAALARIIYLFRR